jgi:hypothetical protein
MHMQQSSDPEDESLPQDIGQGYPEESQGGSGAGAHAEQRADDEPGDEAGDAPHTSGDHDGDPGQATGNPRAAG